MNNSALALKKILRDDYRRTGHMEERRAIEYRQKYCIPEGCPLGTPWGISDFGKTFAHGFHCVGTPSHGGFYLSDYWFYQIPEPFRRDRHDAGSHWFNEDEEAFIVLFFFPEFFRGKPELARAEAVLKCDFWRAYEEHFGVEVKEEESYNKAETLFEQRHREHWVSIYFHSPERHKNVPAGMMGVTATKGGVRPGNYTAFGDSEPRQHGREKKYTLVTREVHKERVVRVGLTDRLVLDEVDHLPWDGPENG